MEDVCTDKILRIEDLSREQLVASCFAILPDSQGNRIRKVLAKISDTDLIDQVNEKLKSAPPSSPTLLHKLTIKNSEAIKPLIARMRKEWPSLSIPHIYN